jgi:hypothetical protein
VCQCLQLEPEFRLKMAEESAGVFRVHMSDLESSQLEKE